MKSIYKLRTVDVWDTLIRRTCHPESIKISVAQYTYLSFLDYLKDEFRDPWKLYLHRLEVESRLAGLSQADGKDNEYVLEHVVTQVLLDVSLMSASQSKEAVQQIVSMEFEFECKNSFPDPDILTFLAEYPAEKTIFLSDFYMTSEMLFKLLDYHGLTAAIPSGICSCDVGLNKRSGRLFTHIQSNFNITPAEHIHIGDNAHSDVTMPELLGIKGVSFLPTAGHHRREITEGLFSSHSYLFEHVQKEILTSYNDYPQKHGDMAASGFLTGIHSAPLFIGYALFVAEQSIQNKVEHTYFQTREGEFFSDVYKSIFKNNKLHGIKLPSFSILEVSRLSTFAASLQSPSIDELSRVWRLLQRQTMNAMFKTLNMPSKTHLHLLEKHQIPQDEIVEQPWKDARVIKLFADKEFQQILGTHVQKENAYLVQYLVAQGLIGKKVVGLVDIGWRGTIQDNLSLVAPNTTFFGYYLGLQRYLNAQPANSHKISFGPNINIRTNDALLLDAITPLEVLCNSPKGSVVSYEDNGSGTKAIRQIDATENIAYEQFTKAFQEGVIFACESWGSYLERYALSSDSFRDFSLKIWKELSENSPEALVKACLSSSQNDLFGFGDFLSNKEIPSLQTILRSFISKSERIEVIQYLKRSQWSAAILYQKDISWAHRIVILNLIILAKQYKHIRIKYIHFKIKLMK